MLPEAKQVHLAEVWLGGLIDRSPLQSATAQSAIFDFFPGVRERLLDNLRLDKATVIMSRVSAYIGQRTGQALDFDALIADPEAVGTIELTDDNRVFARVTAQALRRFGTTYEALADRLEASLGIATNIANIVPATVADSAPSVRYEAGANGGAPTVGDTIAQRYGLIIGIERYQTPNVQAPGAATDAQATYEALTEY
jgi:hypothetical protein